MCSYSYLVGDSVFKCVDLHLLGNLADHIYLEGNMGDIVDVIDKRVSSFLITSVHI